MPVGVQRRVSSRLFLYLGGALLLLILAGVASNAEQFKTTPRENAEPERREILPIEKDLRDTVEDEPRQPPEERDPIEVPPWIGYTLAVAAGLGSLYLLSKQRISLRIRRRKSIAFARSAKAEVTEEEQAEAIADFATELIDELRADDSPRQAIERAYAAVETGFGAKELARKPAETPLRYLDRIFGRHKTVKEPLAQLTSLFQRARFSDEPVDESMRSDAIDSLTEIADYYRTFAWDKIGRLRGKARA